ncbi:unnamed protein product [Arabidopsis halleri]
MKKQGMEPIDTNVSFRKIMNDVEKFGYNDAKREAESKKTKSILLIDYKYIILTIWKCQIEAY